MVGDAEEPAKSVSFPSRHHWRNGLYILGFDLFADRVTVRLFTSRPVQTAELLERLEPYDDVGTRFTPIHPGCEVIDGKGAISFTPLPPSGLSRLGLRDSTGGAGIHPYWRD